MRILVTGATGVVGRRLVPMLRTVDHDISGVASSPVARTQLERFKKIAFQTVLKEQK